MSLNLLSFFYMPQADITQDNITPDSQDAAAGCKSPNTPFRRILRVIIVLCFACAAGRGAWLIATGSEPFLNNDEPRQIMTAVFWHDVIRFHPVSDPRTFATQYYGHYPAIAPLHWPPMQHGLVGLIFFITGPSVGAARMVILTMYLLMLILSYRLAREHIGELGGAVAMILLIAAPGVMLYQSVFMLEIPCMFWMVASISGLSLYVRKGRAWQIWLCGLCTLFALLTKQHALAIGPALIAGAALKLTRRQWLSPHVWLVAILVLAIGGGYYAFAFSSITSSQEDLFVASGNIGGDLLAWIFEFTPVLVVLGIAGACIALRRPRQNWLGCVCVAWIVGVFAIYLIAGIKVSRYLVYSATPFAILSGLAVEFICSKFSSKAWSVAAVFLAAVLACYNMARLPDRYMLGFEKIANEVTEMVGSEPVIFCGRNDGPFILYRRLAAPCLNTITLRSDKLLGCGNVIPTRGYMPQVESPEEIREKIASTGATLLVAEDTPGIDAPEHRWFWKMLDDESTFKVIEWNSVIYPNGRRGYLRLIRYLGPVNASEKLWIPMPTLSNGGFYVYTRWKNGKVEK